MGTLQIKWGQEVFSSVRNYGFQMDHDVLYWSVFMGEPFLLNDEWVGYYDGERLMVYTVSIIDGTIISKQLSIEVSKYFIKNFQINYIEFWGDDIPEPFSLETWTSKLYDTGPDYIGMQIDLQTYDLNEKKIKRRIKEYQRREYHVDTVNRKYFEIDHYRLIRSFINTHNISGFDVAYLSFVDFFLNSKYAMLIEVRNSCDILIGFATVNMFLRKCPILVHNFVSRDYANVSDAIYHKFIVEMLSRNIQIVDLGYSMHKSLKEYKLNWGANKIRSSVRGIQFFQQFKYAESYPHWWSYELKEYCYGYK